MKSLNKVLLEKLAAHRPSRALRLSAAHLGISRISVRMPADSPLFRIGGGEELELPLDDVIAPWVLDHKVWEKDELDFVTTHGPKEPAVLFDIGANIGLMTRQLMHLMPNIVASVCYEPHPLNFLLLSRNLAHLKNCSLIQAAAAEESGQLTFYEDLRNGGNYSLNEDAMRGRDFRTSTVDCVRTHDMEFLSRLSPQYSSLPFIWKSDTQGSDEVIATSLSEAFWSRIQVAIIEISRIRRPAANRTRLEAILSNFSIRRFSGRPNQLSISDILEFADGSDIVHRELLLARV